MLLHSATADPDGKLLDRLPDVLGAMKIQRQRPSAGVSQLKATADPIDFGRALKESQALLATWFVPHSATRVRNLQT
jgi:hypothetical protein